MDACIDRLTPPLSSNLVSFDLAGTSLSNSDVIPLNSSIETLKLVDACIDRLAPFFSSNLVSLDLAGTSLTNSDAISLALLLKKTTRLETLILVECNVHNITCVAEALEGNKSLRTLDLSGNLSCIHSNRRYHRHSQSVFSDLPQDSQVDKLADMLSVNQTLQLLRLSDCGLNQDETSTLFQVFISNQNTTLLTLNVSDNHYNTKHLEEILSSNTSIQYVEITVTAAGKANNTHLMMPYGVGSHSIIISDEDEPDSNDTSGPDTLAYVDESNTLDSLCQVIVSAVNKSTTLQHLIIHTLIEDQLKFKLTRCEDYDKVKNRIQIVQSDNPTIEE